MTIQTAYDRWAASYDHDRNLTRDLDAQLVRAAFAAGVGGRTLEIGCGTGKNTAWLAGVSAQVLALDFSAGMLGAARRKVQAGNVIFARADLQNPWPVESAAVERVVCSLVLEHIADLGAVFAEAYRCLRPGGVFFLSELHPYRQYQGKKARFEAEAGRVEIDAFVHHTADFFQAGRAAGLNLADLGEWRHAEDGADAPPRILTLRFVKGSGAVISQSVNQPPG